MQVINKVILYIFLIIIAPGYSASVNNENMAITFYNNHKDILHQVILKLDSNTSIRRVEPKLGTILMKSYERFSDTEKRTFDELMALCNKLDIINIAVTRYDSGSVMAVWFTLFSEGILARGSATSLLYITDPSLFPRFEAAYDVQTTKINDNWYVWKNIPSGS